MPSLMLRRALLVLAGLAALAFLIDLGGSSIWDANEAFYAETPRQMIARGDYVTPMFNAEPRVNKPVLSYWLVAGLYRLFGVSVGVERLAIALAALAMIAAAVWIARAASRHAAAPVLAALGLAANPRFFMFGRRILIDVLLAALMTATLLFFARAERDPAHRRRWLLLMYVSVGLGLLAKGPVAAALPALAFLVYLAAHRELGRIRDMMIPAGALIAAAIVAPWYVALYRANGWEPIRFFFLGENVGRYVQGFGTEGRGLLFYLPVIFTDGLPWSMLLPAALWAWRQDRRARAQADAPDRRIRTLLLIWIAVIAGFFSLSSTKQDLYILPVAPAVAVLGADILARRAMSGGVFGGVARWGLVVAGLLVAIAGAGVLYVFDRAGSAYLLAGTAVLGGLGLAGGLITAALAVRRTAWAAVALAASLVAVNWTLVMRVLPDFERYKPVVPMSDTIRRHIQPGDRIVHYDVALPSMVFYTERPIDTVFSRDAFLDLVRAGGPVFAVMAETDYDDVKDDLGASACVLERRPTFDAKLREMLARETPPAIVLVTTRCPSTSATDRAGRR